VENETGWVDGPDVERVMAQMQLRENWGNGSRLLQLVPMIARKIFFGHGSGGIVYADSAGRVRGILANMSGQSYIRRVLVFNPYDHEFYVPLVKDRPWWWKHGVKVEPDARFHG
jgi:hypothetical protein